MEHSVLNTRSYTCYINLLQIRRIANSSVIAGVTAGGMSTYTAPIKLYENNTIIWKCLQLSGKFIQASYFVFIGDGQIKPRELNLSIIQFKNVFASLNEYLPWL